MRVFSHFNPTICAGAIGEAQLKQFGRFLMWCYGRIQFLAQPYLDTHFFINQLRVMHQHPLPRVKGVRYPLSKVSSSSFMNGENSVRESSPLWDLTVTQFQMSRGLMVAGCREMRKKKLRVMLEVSKNIPNDMLSLHWLSRSYVIKYAINYH